MLMGSLRFQLTQRVYNQTPQIFKPQRCHCSLVKISGGLRRGARKRIWRSRVLSTEAIQAVQSLKLAKSPAKLEQVFINGVSRLLKADLLDTLAELQRQNEWQLALKVFEYVRKESWCEPDLSLCSDMILMLGKNLMIEKVEELFNELKREGLQPDTRAYTEVIGAYFKVDMIDKALEMYELMKTSGCAPDKLTFTILIRNLERAGKEDIAAKLRKDCTEYLDSPEKFLEELDRKYSQRRYVNPI